MDSTRLPQQRFHFDRERLGALAENNRSAYLAAQPFPHVVMDDFVPDEVLDEVVAEFPAPREAQWRAFDNPRERKLASNDDSAMGEATRHLLTELNSAPFVDFLQRLTDIEGLVPDPHLVGGGLHQIERGGHLNVHADFNRHPATGLERRLNVLLYLNREWRHEYGGALELWSRDMSACEARILPLFNRCLVFSTTSTSFHGHPEPVACPEGETRKSIALYYYSRDRPPDEGREAHDTLFQARPGEQVPETLAGRASTLGARFKGAARQVLPPIVLTALRRMRAGRR